MTLTQEQHAARREGIGGNDATRIMAGDWLALWRIKTGRAEPEDLSRNFAVRLGSLTEALNLEFLGYTPGWYVEPAEPGKTWKHPFVDFMLCHPDGIGLYEGDGLVIECKHVNAFSKPDEIRQRYYWQLVHNVACLHADGFRKGALSVVYGNRLADPVIIEPQAADYELLLETEERFWWHVVNDKEPADRPPELPPMPEPERVVDMMAGNRRAEWFSVSADWRAHYDAAKRHAAAEKALKEMAPDDAAAAYGDGVIVTRNKAGALRVQALTPHLRKKFNIG